MLDQKVIAALLDSREAYDKVIEHLEEKDLSLQGQTWLPLIKDWYAGDKSAKSVDRELLRDLGSKKLPEMGMDALLSWWDDLPESDGAEAVVNHVLELKRYVKGNELCAAIQGRKPHDSILEEYTDLMRSVHLGKSEVIWTMDNSEMDAQLDRKNLIRVGPPKLNKERLQGGASRGDTILVFGRPEAGKTLFTVNAVSGFLRFGHRVLYIGNEEGTYKTRKRIIQSLTSTTRDEYDESPTDTIERAVEAGLDNLHICHMQPGTIPEIEELVKEVQPDVVVLDQIRNVELANKKDSFVQKLGDLGTAMRNLAQKYQFLSWSVTQAGDKTERHGQEPPPYLTMSDIADNRTSLAAQFDVIIGVGVNEELRRQDVRIISFCKNKLNEEPEGHEPLQVRVDMRRSQVK